MVFTDQVRSNMDATLELFMRETDNNTRSVAREFISNIYDAGKKLRKNIVCPDIIIYRLQACRLPQEVYFRQE